MCDSGRCRNSAVRFNELSNGDELSSRHNPRSIPVNVVSGGVGLGWVRFGGDGWGCVGWGWVGLGGLGKSYRVVGNRVD